MWMSKTQTSSGKICLMHYLFAWLILISIIKTIYIQSSILDRIQSTELVLATLWNIYCHKIGTCCCWYSISYHPRYHVLIKIIWYANNRIPSFCLQNVIKSAAWWKRGPLKRKWDLFNLSSSDFFPIKHQL